MAVNIHNLIAAISPDVYCKPGVKEEVKKILAEKGYTPKAYLEAAKEAKAKDQEPLDLYDITRMLAPAALLGIKSPSQKNMLVYDTFNEGAEAIYFWILDKMTLEGYKGSEKLVDNFVASPGSGHFSEMGAKATKMQEEAMKMLGAANQVIKSILNIIYDLKEFRLRLEVYDDYKGKNPAKKAAALLSLKQVWMDTVDIKKGTTALKGLVQQFDYVTIIDAFMATQSLDEVIKPVDKGGLDLNERVRRILQQRVQEFYRWIDESERELRKRFEIEKIYLKSQVNTVKLYARWAKPYLRWARKLEQNANEKAEVVTTFNSSVMELVVMGLVPYKPDQDIKNGDLPAVLEKAKTREYTGIALIEYRFRSSPERGQQGGYGFRGRSEINFTSYGLNNEELDMFRKAIAEDDFGDVLAMVEGATSESLDVLADDISEFLDESPQKPKSKSEKKKESSKEESAFSSLLNIFSAEKPKLGKNAKIIAPDTFLEKYLRSCSIVNGRRRTYRIYDHYKKSKGYPTFPFYN